MSEGIFLINSAGALVEMPEAPHVRESDFQALLADYPKLLAGDQLSPDSPIRWLLVRREAGIPDSEDSGARWAVDHLFLDQDAVPTLVEVKRSSDSRLRREVIGQMLDYAANAVVYWPVSEVRAMFSSACESRGVEPDAVIAQFLQDEEDPEVFWGKLKTNLQAGRVRLMFVADSIPAEIRRIVEFLNEQMDPAEVLAVEIKRYEGGGVAAVVPRLIGRTAEAERRKSPGRTTTLWTKESFFDAVRASGNHANLLGAKRLFGWCEARGLRLDFGRGERAGSLSPKFVVGREAHNLFTIWTDGGLAIQLGSFKPPFDDNGRKHELIARLNNVRGLDLGPEMVAKWPTRRVGTIAEDRAFDAFTSAFEWMFTVIEGASSSA